MGFTNNDILTLARAGFTATQISALNSVGTNPPATATTPATAPENTTTPATVNNSNDILNQILGAIQTNAINATQQPQPQTTDDILAEIINPNNND